MCSWRVLYLIRKFQTSNYHMCILHGNSVFSPIDKPVERCLLWSSLDLIYLVHCSGAAINSTWTGAKKGGGWAELAFEHLNLRLSEEMWGQYGLNSHQRFGTEFSFTKPLHMPMQATLSPGHTALWHGCIFTKPSERFRVMCRHENTPCY